MRHSLELRKLQSVLEHFNRFLASLALFSGIRKLSRVSVFRRISIIEGLSRLSLRIRFKVGDHNPVLDKRPR